MSDFDENVHPAAVERRIDLLVDGELSEADRRALLLELEHDPDGWRRCALAFLEAQCWKAEMGQMARPAAQVRGSGAPGGGFADSSRGFAAWGGRAVAKLAAACRDHVDHRRQFLDRPGFRHGSEWKLVGQFVAARCLLEDGRRRDPAAQP